MSLINKMLQDLDERRGQEGKADSFSLEVKAVHASPQGGGIARWWWMAVLVPLLGVGIWFLSLKRPVAVIQAVPEIVQEAQLPLKMTNQLTLTTSLREQEAAVQGPSLSVRDIPEQAADTSSPVEKNGSNGEAAAAKAGPIALPLSPATSISSNAQAKSGSEERAPRLVENVRSVADAAPKTPVPPVPRVEAPAGPLPAKQVTELSSRERAENEYRRAAGLIQQARFGEAISALEQALALDPKHSGARQTLVGLLLDVKRTDDAMRTAQEGLALDSSQAGLAMILARLQVDKGDLSSAIETLQRSLPAGAERADYQAFAGALMQRAGRHKEAVAHYTVAVRKAPQNGVWLMGLGISLQAEDRSAEAQEAFSRAKATGNLSAPLLEFVEQRLLQLQR